MWLVRNIFGLEVKSRLTFAWTFDYPICSILVFCQENYFHHSHHVRFHFMSFFRNLPTGICPLTCCSTPIEPPLKASPDYKLGAKSSGVGHGVAGMAIAMAD